MKRVLITAGTVYGRLDDNKLVGNRIRGIWAGRFACWLHARGYSVTLLVPDTMDREPLRKALTESAPVRVYPDAPIPTFEVKTHDGYDSYAEQCYALAPEHDAAVMAAAVVNWIPKNPVKGKMATEGFPEGAEQLIPFYLAPRVIDRMKKLNPHLTLVGCKMTAQSPEERETEAGTVALLRIAYKTLLKAHCNVVIANDLGALKTKLLVYPDGHAQRYQNDFEGMYRDLEVLFTDKFYQTAPQLADYKDVSAGSLEDACRYFDAILEKYRSRFTKRPEGPDGPDRVFGSLAVRIDATRVLVSPREKGTMFSSQDAVVVANVDRRNRTIHTVRGRKATLNAPLLCAVLHAFEAPAVLHLHEETRRDWPAYDYAPPGSVRDNDRQFVTPAFNITGHGFVAALDNHWEFLR